MIELSSRPRSAEESNERLSQGDDRKSTSQQQQQYQSQQQQLLAPTTINPPTTPLSPHDVPVTNNATFITIHRKLCLLAPLLLCLYMLTDSNYYYYNKNYQSSSSSEMELVQQHQHQHHHHLAFVTALSRHPPSLRVFRIVSEGAFLLACAAGALWIWERCGEHSSMTITTPPPSPTKSTFSNHASSFSMGDDEKKNYINHGHGNDDDDNDDDDDQDEENGKIPKRIDRKESFNVVELRITSHAVGRLLFAPPPTAAWGSGSSSSRLLRLVPTTRIKNNKKERNGRPSRRVSGFVDNDKSGNGRSSSSGSVSSCSSDVSNHHVEYPKDGSSHSLKRRKNSPTTTATTATTTSAVGNLKDNENIVAAAIESGARSPSVLAATASTAAAAAIVVADTTSTTEIQTSDTSDDENHNMPSTKQHRQQSSLLLSSHTTTTHPLPPSPTSVLGAALDIITVTCMFLIFFTISSAEGGRYIDQASDHVMGQQYMKFVANVAAPLFPLTLFGISLLATCIPWKKRRSLWSILSLTWCAPFHPVTFRDGFIGDILTSIVRPLQDLAFTILFVPLGLKAWWSSDMYTMDAAAIPLERSWLLHTVVLPACTLSPLWWRFMQNLRQCYDAKQRWPYLGNALKYLLAAEVSTFGLFNPSVKQSPLWMICFFLTTLYQVWWDMFMDWGLLERDSNLGYYYATADRRRWFWWWPYTLRSKRLYKRTWMYHAIFIINFCLRFVGMITLIPPVYLSRTTGLIVSAYKDPDFQLFVGLFVALAEIFRRTIWALLRLEWEVIKTAPEGRTMERKLSSDVMKPMAIATSVKVWSLPTERDISVSSLSDMRNLNDIQILGELCVWATVFSGIAIIAAAHREVL